MSQWFIKRNDKQVGPFEASRLKQLAVEGKIKPDDLVRREDQEAWSKASQIKGLLNLPAAPTLPVEPPAPSPGVQQSTPPTSEAASTFSFGAMTKTTAQLSVKQTELLKIQQVSLPAQYVKIGQKVFEAKIERSDNELLFNEIEKLCDTVVELNKQSEQQPAGTTFIEKTKSLGNKAVIATKVQATEYQRRQKLIQLGTAIVVSGKSPTDCSLEIQEVGRLQQRLKEV